MLSLNVTQQTTTSLRTLRNSAVVGFQASTTVAQATKIYLRYDGEIANGTDNHALNVGVRFSW